MLHSVWGVERTGMPTEYAKTIAKNLRRIMYDKGISAAELSKATGISKGTLLCWMNAIRTPRADGIDRLCEYLNIERADLVQEEPHYKNPETEKVAQEIMDNKELKMLFDAVRDISPEEMKLIHDMALALKRKERE